MHCPKCGTERVSDATIFCSRCGLYLDHIKDVMEAGGEPVGGPRDHEKAPFLNSKNIRIFSLLWFLVVTVFLLPISAIMGGEAKMLAVLGLMGPVGAAFLLILSMFFPAASGKGSGRRQFPEKTAAKQLPPERTVFAEDFVAPSAGPGRRTPDLEKVSPPSVTEETTRHLDEKLKK